jgi:endonuclease/exonuclease/phosphatase family metal-dependent hydrolase
MLRVMSYNIQGHAVLKRKQHIREVADVIRQLRPDVVGLQEVHKNTHSLRSGDQIADLAQATGMELFFGKSTSFGGGEYGNAVLARGKIDSGRVHELPGGGETRSILECSVIAGGYTFTIFVAHLAAWFRFSRGTRAAQLERLAEVIHPSKAPYFLVGDFNTGPRSPEMTKLLASEQLRLCGEHVEMSHRLSRTRLDYIFADPSWKTSASWVVRLGPSDHWPLIADVVTAGT